MTIVKSAQKMIEKDDPRRKVAEAELDTIKEKTLVLWKVAKELQEELFKKDTINENLMFELNTVLWKSTETIANIRKSLKVLSQKLSKAPGLRVIK